MWEVAIRGEGDPEEVVEAVADFITGLEGRLERSLEPAELRYGPDFNRQVRKIRARVPEPEPEEEEDAVLTPPRVDFASDKAADAALDAKLSPADFDGRTPTGATGFTVADVEAIIAARGE
jgi:hypothetical protein